MVLIQVVADVGQVSELTIPLFQAIFLHLNLSQKVFQTSPLINGRHWPLSLQSQKPNASEKLSDKRAQLYIVGKYIRYYIIINYGASHHLTGDITLLTNVTTIAPCPITMPNGQLTWAKKYGSLNLGKRLVLNNVFYVFYVPHLAITLILDAQLLRDVAEFVALTKTF